MQLDPGSSHEDLDEGENSDLHILVMAPNPSLGETDVVMEEGNLSCALAESESLCPFQSNISIEELDSAVNSIQLEGEKIASPEKADCASLSSSDAALLDSPLAPLAPIPKFEIEDNLFSLETYPADADMYPSLPAPQGSVPPPITTPVPHGPILLDGVYYQLVPAPHNVVVAQSTVPTPSLVPCTSTTVAEPVEVLALSTSAESKVGSTAAPSLSACSEPQVGLEFAMPESPPPNKKANPDASRSRCRSTSSSRSCDEVKASITPKGLEASATYLKRGRGRGRKIVELTNSPLLIPTVKSHLSRITKPKEELTVTVPAENGATNDDVPLKFPTAIEHLSQLDKDVSTPLKLSKPTSPEPGTMVEFQQEPLHEDSNVDLETGEVRIPTSSFSGAVKMTLTHLSQHCSCEHAKCLF